MCEVSESLHKRVDQAGLAEDVIQGARNARLVDMNDDIISVWTSRAKYGYPTPSLHRDEALEAIIMASYRAFSGNDTARLSKTAENIKDICRINEIFAERYPEFSTVTARAGVSGMWPAAGHEKGRIIRTICVHEAALAKRKSVFCLPCHLKRTRQRTDRRREGRL